MFSISCRAPHHRRLSIESLEPRQLLSVAEPNNTPDQAVVVPDIYLETQYFAQDVVSTATDVDDYFKFYNLYGASHLYVALYGLSSDADLYVYNGAEQLMLSSTAGGNLSENIQLDLPGNDYYYVRVKAFSGTTNYNLLMINDYAGATPATARDLGTAWGQTNSKFYPYNEIFYREYLDFRDNVDLVKFRMEAPGTISVRRQPVNLPSTVVTTTQLLDSSQSLLTTAANGDGGQNIDRHPVPAGDYFLKITHVDGAGEYQFRITADYAGETTATARDLGNLTGSSRQMFDMVGGPFLPSYEDAVDYYRFTFDEPAPLDIRLTIPDFFTQPTFDAGLRLARDLDGNGFISAGEVILASNNSGTDSISTFLDVGTYFVLVDQNGAYTNYVLNLDSDFDAIPFEADPSKSMAQARVAGPLVGEIFFNDGVGISAGDFRDYYQFSMATAGKFTGSISINPFYSRYHLDPSLFVVQDANLNHLYDAGEEVTPFAFSGVLEADLPAGNFFLAVTVPGDQAAYTVRLLPDYAGNTLGAARVVAEIGGPQVFRDYIEQDFGPESDVDDFYRFTLPSATQVNLTTTGVDGEDLSLSLIRDANSNGIIDGGDVLATSDEANSPFETISRALEAGSYFARIMGINGATNYALTLQVGAGAEQADFNGDGFVNAADYVSWRNRGGPPEEYELWRSYYGQAVPPPAAASAFAPATIDGLRPRPNRTETNSVAQTGDMGLGDQASTVTVVSATRFDPPLAAKTIALKVTTAVVDRALESGTTRALGFRPTPRESRTVIASTGAGFGSRDRQLLIAAGRAIESPSIPDRSSAAVHAERGGDDTQAFDLTFSELGNQEIKDCWLLN